TAPPCRGRCARPGPSARPRADLGALSPRPGQAGAVFAVRRGAPARPCTTPPPRPALPATDRFFTASPTDAECQRRVSRRNVALVPAHPQTRRAKRRLASEVGQSLAGAEAA